MSDPPDDVAAELRAACDSDRLITFIEGADRDVERHLTEIHIRECVACRDEFWRLLELVENLKSRDGDAWVPLEPSVDIDHFAAELRARRDFEESRSAAESQRILSLPVTAWRGEVQARPHLISATFVTQLLDAGVSALLTSLARAREICDFATFVADRVERETGIAQHEVRAAAWRDLAYVLVRLGEGEMALVCLASAMEAARASVDRTHQMAIVEFGRAIAMYELQRYAACLDILREVRCVFEEVSDRRRYNATREQEAIVLSAQGRGAAAAEIYLDLFSDAEGMDSSEAARLYANATRAFEAAGQYTIAAEYVGKAMRIHEQLGDRVEVAKDLWRTGTLLAKQGRFGAARENLILAGEHLALSGSLGRSEVHLLLDRIELEIDAGEMRDEEIRELAGAAASAAVEANLPIATADAMAFLKRPSLSASDVRRVRDFLRELEVYPQLSFVPAS